MNPPLSNLIAGVLFFVIPCSLPLGAQPSTSDDQNQRQKIRAENLSPGFLIKPLVKELKAPPGTTANFEFRMTNLGSTRRLKARPVAVTQSKSGSIGMDASGEPPSEISLTSPEEIDVGNREEAVLTGTIDVSSDMGRYKTYGVLVTDLGREVNVTRPEGSSGEEKREISINYVTRFLLRLNLTVSGAPRGDASALQIKESGLRSRDGFAHVYALVHNPTSDVFQFKLDAQLKKKKGEGAPVGPPFPLFMPSNESESLPDKFQSRILSDSTVLLRRKIPDPIFPGDYSLEFQFRTGPRTIRSSTVKQQVSVKEGQFPAQKSVVSRIVNRIAVKPVHVQFSRRSGGDRIKSLTLKNTSQQKVKLQLRSAPEQAKKKEKVSWLIIQPDTITIPPGGSRNVRLTASTTSRKKEHLYAHILMKVTPLKTVAGGTARIPVAFLSRGKLTVRPEFGELQVKTEGNRPSIFLPVRNRGNVHLSLDGTMRVKTGFGETVKLKGGYGRWVLPGRKRDMNFPLQNRPPSGTYETTITIHPGHNQDPIKIERTLQVE